MTETVGRPTVFPHGMGDSEVRGWIGVYHGKYELDSDFFYSRKERQELTKKFMQKYYRAGSTSYYFLIRIT